MDLAFKIFSDFVSSMVEISILFILVTLFVGILVDKFNLDKKLNGKSRLNFVKAIILGALTPFCSCSTIPVFRAFLKNGVNFAVSFAFLMTSPLINPVLSVLFISAFGLKITLFYIVFIFIFVFILSNFVSILPITHLLKGEIKQTTKFKLAPNLPKIFNLNPKTTKSFKFRLNQAFLEFRKFFPHLCIAMLVGSILGEFAPSEILLNIDKYGILGIVLASVIGIFLYLREAMLIPLGFMLIQAQIPLGIVFSFIIAGGGSSLPEIIILNSMFKKKMLILFVCSVLVIANVFGLLLHFFL